MFEVDWLSNWIPFLVFGLSPVEGKSSFRLGIGVVFGANLSSDSTPGLSICIFAKERYFICLML